MEKTSVLIVGAGPVGLFLGLRLAHASIPVTVLEVADEVGSSSGSKAIVYQPSLYPELQKAGVLDDLKAAGAFVGFPVYRKTSTKEVVVALPNPPGAPRILLLPQWRFIEILEEKLGKMDGARVLRGYQVTAVDESQASVVSLTVKTVKGEEKRFEAGYIVGADGGKSFIRKTCGISFDGDTLPSQLVATDVRYPFDKHGFSDTQFMMDPHDYGLISKIDDTGLWRVSFSLPNNASQHDIESQLPLKFEIMFPGPRPLKYEVKNVAPYKCQQLCASTMRKERILLVGDAAHLTNPYAGLGLTTGFFDASSLADILASICNRGATERLLEAWSSARLKVYHKFVDPLSRAAFYRVQDPNLDSILERDPMFKAARAGKMTAPPSLATDVSKFEGFIV